MNPVVVISGAWLIAGLLLAGCAREPLRPAASGSGEAPLSIAAPAEAADDRALADLLEAEFALAEDDEEGALDAYLRAADASSDPRVAERAAELAGTRGDRAGAAGAIERMEATGASERALARERARLALLRGHRDVARDELAKLLADGTTASWGEASRVLLGARDAALAGVVLEELADESRLPEDPAVWVAMSQLGEQLNRHLWAERIASAAAARFEDERVLAWAAHLKLAAGQEEAGLALYARAARLDPQNVELRHAWAAALARAGDEAAAIKVLADGPQNLATLATRAAWAARQRDEGSLRTVFDALRERRDGGETDGDFLLGQVAEALGEKARALEYYAAVPVTDENMFTASVRRAVLLYQMDQRDAAQRLVRELQESVAQDADQQRQAFQLEAEFASRDGDPARAVEAYSRALAALPDDSSLLYGRALAAADLGDTERAVADLRRILELTPDDTDAMNALGYTLADADRDLDEAQALISTALAANPDEPAIIDSWGWVRYRQGDLEEAETFLRRAWELRRDTEIGLHLGEVLWKRGELDAARALLEELRKADPEDAAVERLLQRLGP